MIYFITGNKNKFQEIKDMLGLPLEQLEIDLPEPQSLSAQEIIEAKLLAAEAHAAGHYIVEDTSLYLECLGGQLPGPFIKWFLQTMEPEGIADLVTRMGNSRATATSIIGYIDENKTPQYFEGTLNGTIVSPRGDKDFGWGPIFQPDNTDKTFGEMEREEKYAMSMRGIATRKLADLLKANNG